MNHIKFGTKFPPSYIKVEKVDGRVMYYKVVDEQNIEITEQEYKDAHKENN